MIVSCGNQTKTLIVVSCTFQNPSFNPLWCYLERQKNPTHCRVPCKLDQWRLCTSLTPFFLFLFHPFNPPPYSCHPSSLLPSLQCPGLTDHVPTDDSQADVWALSGLWGGFPHQLEWRKGCSYTGSLAKEILWGKGQSTQKWERERERSRKESKEKEKVIEIYPKSSTTTL